MKKIYQQHMVVLDFIDSYQFLSSSLDSLMKTLVEKSPKTFKKLKEEIGGDDEILNIC